MLATELPHQRVYWRMDGQTNGRAGSLTDEMFDHFLFFFFSLFAWLVVATLQFGRSQFDNGYGFTALRSSQSGSQPASWGRQRQITQPNGLVHRRCRLFAFCTNAALFAYRSSGGHRLISRLQRLCNCKLLAVCICMQFVVGFSHLALLSSTMQPGCQASGVFSMLFYAQWQQTIAANSECSLVGWLHITSKVAVKIHQGHCCLVCGLQSSSDVIKNATHRMRVRVGRMVGCSLAAVIGCIFVVISMRSGNVTAYRCRRNSKQID